MVITSPIEQKIWRYMPQQKRFPNDTPNVPLRSMMSLLRGISRGSIIPSTVHRPRKHHRKEKIHLIIGRRLMDLEVDIRLKARRMVNQDPLQKEDLEAVEPCHCPPTTIRRSERLRKKRRKEIRKLKQSSLQAALSEVLPSQTWLVEKATDLLL